MNEYTLAEIARMLRLTKNKVSNDFYRKRFSGRFAVRKFKVGFAMYEVNTTKPTWLICSNELGRYIEYLKCKNKLTIDTESLEY